MAERVPLARHPAVLRKEEAARREGERSWLGMTVGVV